MPGLVDVGGPNADVTLYQFYDLNCPFCREAAEDVDTLLRGDEAAARVRALSVLSAMGRGRRVELALRELGTPQKFLEFHRKIYGGRGLIDGNRALAVAQTLGFDRKKVIDDCQRQAGHRHDDDAEKSAAR